MTTDNLLSQGGQGMELNGLVEDIRQIRNDGHCTREVVAEINAGLRELKVLLEERTETMNRRFEATDNKLSVIETTVNNHALKIQASDQAITDLKHDLERDAIKKKDMLDRQQARNNFIFAVMGIILTILTGLAMPILIYLLTK